MQRWALMKMATYRSSGLTALEEKEKMESQGRKSAHLLKGTNIGIAEQFPKEIADARKALYPVFKKAKKEGNMALLIKDKFFINGQRYQALPMWSEVDRLTRWT